MIKEEKAAIEYKRKKDNGELEEEKKVEEVLMTEEEK